jgi:hypothetical protein
MPLYSTRCEKCGTSHGLKLSFSDYDAVKLGTKLLECATCQGPVVLKFDPGDVNFVLKDGESGGWASKANRENKYRVQRRAVMERRQRDHAPNPKLTPNFAGELASSWSEAKSMAFEKAYEETRDASAANEAASTYNPLVQQETPR